MNLRKILLPVALGLFSLAAAHASNVYVLPSSGTSSAQMQIFNEQIQTVGAATVPGGSFQIFRTAQSDRVVVLSKNNVSPVSFVTLPNGPVSNLTLDSQQAISGAISPDGLRVLVLAGGSPGSLYIIDALTGNIQTGGKLTIPGAPKEVVVSQDSHYAYVVSSNNSSAILTVVDLSTNQQVNQTAVTGAIGALHISLAPTGQVYITGQYLMVEFDGLPPFAEHARSQVISNPGKLHFSADGRYALAINELSNGFSLVCIDLKVTNDRAQAGTETSKILISSQSGTAVMLDQLFLVSGTAAVGYSSTEQKMYGITYPTLSAVELPLSGVGVPTGVTSVTRSDEFPATRNLYYTTGGKLYRYDLAQLTQTGSADVGDGTAQFAASPNTSSAAATLYTYGGGRTIQSGSTVLYQVRATDNAGRPVAGANVTFSADTAGVTLANSATATNLDGYAWTSVTAPGTNGDFGVRAVIGTVSAVITNTVTGGTGSGGNGGNGGGDGGNTNVARILKVSGDGQFVQNLYSVDIPPMVVKVVDADGKPLAGKQVTWSATTGLQLQGLTTQVTDANGLASMEFYTVGDFQSLSYLTFSVTATCVDINSSTTFTISAFKFGPENSPIIFITNPPQESRNITAKLGTRLDGAIHAIVATATGTPVPGIGLRVTSDYTDPTQGPVATCDGATALNGTVLTAANGEVDCNLIVTGRIGSSNLLITVGDIRNFGGYTLTVLPGDPIAPVVVQGDNQTGKPGVTLPLALTARIVDSSGNYLVGTAVTWTVVTSSSVTLTNTISQADTNGLVSTRVILGPNPGKYKVRLTAGGKITEFNLTVETLATGFTKVSGDSQAAAPINTAFSQPLVVKVTNATGGAVQGATVNWTTTGSVTLSATTSVTGADGLASVTATAGSVPGAITVTAAVTNLPSLTFSLTSRLPGPGITTASFTNFATGQAGIAPGLLVQITGAGLAPGITGQVNASILSGKLPIILSGVTVEFQWMGGSSYAPIYRVANENGVESVLVQAPFEITGTTVTAVVNVSGGSTTVTNIPVSVVSPGVLEDVSNGRRAAVVIRSDGAAVTPATPARPGEHLRMYAIGLGQTSPTVYTNQVGVPEQTVLANIAVGLDNAGIEVISATMAQNLIGVYEITFVVPMSTTQGDHPLGFVMEAVPGQQVYANGSILAVGQ